MKKLHLGIILGLVAGIIDLIPMIIQNLTWDANLSAFTLWIVIGFFISVTDIRIKGILKGLVISFITILPTAILIGWKEPISLLPIAVMTIFLGSALGYFIEKYGK